MHWNKIKHAQGLTRILQETSVNVEFYIKSSFWQNFCWKIWLLMMHHNNHTKSGFLCKYWKINEFITLKYLIFPFYSQTLVKVLPWHRLLLIYCKIFFSKMPTLILIIFMTTRKKNSQAPAIYFFIRCENFFI